MRKESTLFTIFCLALLVLVSVQCSKDDDPATAPPTTPPNIPSPSKTGAVQGKVSSENNQLLNGVVLTIQGNGVNTSEQTVAGSYLFQALVPGYYNVSVKKNGYIETSAAISITAGDTTLKDFTLKAGTAYFSLLSDSVITAHPYAKNYSIKVASNTSWVISSAQDWITPAKTSSSDDDSIVVKITASPSDTVRQGNLVLQAGGIVKNIQIRQLPNVNLKQVIAIPGNLALGIQDSIALVFNQPVSIKSNFPANRNCQSAMVYSYEGNKVTFSYACAVIGGEYSFTITTNNSLGDQYTFTPKVGFYEKIVNFTGGIKSYYVNDADNSYWVLADHPNALYKIDMASLKILHKYDLPSANEPVLLTVNPYNNKIYVAFRGIPKLYILNQNGITEQMIDIPHDNTRNTYEWDGPQIYPMKLVFTKNGKGMIWLTSKGGYSYSYYSFIDAAADHRIWFESLPGDFNIYYSGKVNYDQTKIILSCTNDNATIGIFDAQQMKFSNYKPTNAYYGRFVTPSRKNSDIFSGQLYSQLIVNPATGYESLVSNRGIGNSGNVDFCYKPGKERSVYFVVDNKLQIIDYTNLKTPVQYDALYYIQGTTATLDGKYLIMSQHDGNYNSKIFQVSTTWFDY